MATKTKRTKTQERAPEKTAAEQRRIQEQVDRVDAKAAAKSDAKSKKPQTGARAEPTPPLPKQHLAKPGNEHELALRPKFEAPDYRGSGKLEGMNAIVTGADSGIGRAVAVLFAREGANVAILYLDEHDDAKETRRHVEREGARCVAIAGDVRDPAFCDRAVKQVLMAFGSIEILVNNAAFQEHCAKIEDLTEEHLQETLQTNIGGYFHMARAVAPHLKAGSCIINTGSETAFFGSAELLDYSATKGAIHAFTKSLAKNMLTRGVRVNCVAPGPVWTPLNPADRPAKDVAKFGAESDMGRPAQPEEISPAYVFLAAPSCSSYVNGAILPVMGGPTG